MTNSGLSLYTIAALLRNNHALRCPVFLLLQPHPCYNHATYNHEVTAQLQPMSLLPSSSSAIATAFRLRSLGYHLPTDISHLKNRSLDNLAASSQNRNQSYCYRLLPPPLLLPLATILYHCSNHLEDFTIVAPTIFATISQ
ncbi:hypothetical protein BHE74_00013498 [Ensete ventricosum]|nr:hypothetical protein BHE74_00013498 [Ensete ventricosum]